MSQLSAPRGGDTACSQITLRLVLSGDFRRCYIPLGIIVHVQYLDLNYCRNQAFYACVVRITALITVQHDSAYTVVTAIYFIWRYAYFKGENSKTPEPIDEQLCVGDEVGDNFPSAEI